ncbi:type VI secretion system tip protein VgrG [Pseudoxanthomonas kalamensis DSM 18571]|uniref:type VI secretion system Vgr family protein n=1 Tax=Pseudoxanthomonas kalamensis TaxID=289483 RepID=UPI001391C6AA|nr:type VI secretion system Vgr family protein [Pseudoxanthomonas kalamensis]KAF1712523.1 type VI secretion system tip protein VgrG [Pseudoxanthomonas kalamensis DSM 18571]
MGIVETSQSLLAALARYVGSGRLHELESDAVPADAAVERWQGWERLADGYEWWVDVLSSDAGWDLDALGGQPATLKTRLARDGFARRSGVIREAACLGADGGLARYRLCLVPWTWWLGQGRHSRVFQDRSVLQIVEAVFADYAPLAVWQVADEVGPFLAEAPPRSYCVQYRESDHAFVTRLLAEEGLGWCWQEDESAPAGHRLLIFADSTTLADDACAADGGIRFHRSDATESDDSVQAIGREHRLGAAKLSLLGTDYKHDQAITAQLPLGLDDVPVSGEVYDPAGAYAFADTAQGRRYAGLLAQAREAQLQHWQGQGTVRSFRAGTGFTLTQAPLSAADGGEYLLLSVQQAGFNNLPDTLREGVQALLGPSSEPASPTPATGEGWQALWQRAERVGYANAFLALSRQQPWRPVLQDGTGALLNPRPTAPGYQSAIVVADEGADAQELYCDALGRVKVKFHFQQGREADDRNSCWLRVAQRYAGPGVGAQFLPRIGQEVLVGFLDGDIDRPLILGSLYNGRGEAGVAATPGGQAAESDLSAYAQAGDHRPSAQANLAGGQAPLWHGMGAGDQAHRNAAAMWGIQSKEWNGSGHSRLVFDDSDGQLRLQLATTQAASQLNLGHLIHQADNFRGSFRGEGFELRTDGWGAVRAEAGLWLSAHAHAGQTPAGDAVAPAALLKQAQAVAQVFSQAAGTHRTVKLAVHEGVGEAKSSLIDDQAPLQALLASVKTTVDGSDYGNGRGEAIERSPASGDGRVPHSGDAVLGIAAPAGIGLVAGQSLHWSVGETLTLASGQASNAAIAGNLRLHSGQAIGWLTAAVEGAPEQTALSLVAGEGKLEFEAQHDSARLQSRDGLKIVSANAEVELAAGKTVHLAVAGGASLTLEGGNIVIACPGKITVHAARKDFEGPAHLSREMNSWPEAKFDEVYVVRHELTGEPLKDVEVELQRADGAILRLKTDAQGKLPRQQSAWMDQVTMRVLEKVKEEE